MFDYLKPHEIILLISGAILFIVCIFILIHFARSDRNITAIVPFFVISIIMVGFPSYTSIQIGDSILTIEEELKKPKSAARIENLKKDLNKIDDDRIKVIKDPEALLTLKKAADEVGDSNKSKIAGEQFKKIKK